MPTRDQSVADRAYRVLLRALPFDFRGDFGSEMEEVFREQRATVARRRGGAGLIALWWETMLGIFRTAPREHLAILALDARHALRMMRRDLGFTALAVIILGLGIGANTALFSVVHAILLRPLPYSHGSDLVMIHQSRSKAGLPEMSFSVAEIQDYRHRNHTFSAIAEYHSMTFTLLGQGEAQRVRTGVVSSDFFDIFGVTPILGRTFAPSDERPDSPPVLLMSYEYWKQRGSDREIVGKRVRMNDREHIVIGVLPSLPQYPDENDVFMPTSACPFRSASRIINDRGARMMQLFGRLKSGVTLDRARTDLAAVARELEREYPDYYPTERGYVAAATPLKQELTQKARPMLWLLMGAASFVLLIACANVANLMLARIARREHELVVRSAMGAATSRLLRQFLTESLLIATLAAAVGVLFASASMRLLTDFAARLTPRAREIALDQSALLYAIAVAVATTLLFGSLAALCTRKDLSSNLKEGNFTWRPSRVRMRNILVICQVAFSFLLLTGAGLLSRSIVKLMGVDPGFAVEKTFAVGIDLNWTAYASEQVRGKLAASLLDKLRSEPAITSAALSSSYPFDSDAVACCGWEVSFRTDATSSGAVAVMRSASSGYFQTLGVPILVGRAFTPEDQADGPPVAIVSRQLASRSWPGETAIGKRLSYDHRQLWIKVVGVVGDVKEYGLSRATPDEIYRPLAQMETRIGAILVRSTASADVVSNVARQVIRDVDPEIAIARIEPVDRARTDSIRVNTIATGLLGMFAIIALAIALTGVGGILALSVSRRMREIAIRMALGAKPANLLLMIIRQGMSPVLIGLALGWAAAAALTSMLTTLLFNVGPTDPVTFLGVSALLCLAALVACYIPAWRALRIDPHVALRAD